MRAGTLRHRLELQTATEARDSSGQLIKTWTKKAALWAEIKPLSAREFEKASGTGSERTHEIRIRYRADVTDETRLKFGSRIFNIEGVRNLHERDRELVVDAVEEA